MIIDTFPNRPIYKVKYPNFKELTVLISAIEENISLDFNFFEKMKGVCCLVQHNKYPLKTQLTNDVPWIEYLYNLNKFVELESTNYLKLLDHNSKSNLKIEAVWFSYYPDNTYFEYHRHTNVAAVAVFYLKKPSNSGNMWIKENENDIQEYEIIGEEGDLMIFPGFLPHKTTANLSKESRIAITFDLMS